MKLTLRCRLAGSVDWKTGQTDNIRKSGVLFRTEHSGPLFRRHMRAVPQQPFKLVLELPTTNPHPPVSRVRCLGEVVRTAGPEAPDMLPTVAATVHDYRLASA